MRIAIDNLDGNGAIDYTECLSAFGPLKLTRKLNAPSTCTCTVDLSHSDLAQPVRRGRAIVTAESGTVLFTGYVATNPDMVFAGQGVAGPVYLLSLALVSDEWLLERQYAGVNGAWLAMTGGAALAALTGDVEGALLTTTLSSGRSIGVLRPAQGSGWSGSAGRLADAVYEAYRAVAGAIDLVPVGSVTHVLSESDGHLDPGSLRLSTGRQIANDITISGEIEPAAFVTDVFSADGTTNLFQASDTPYVRSSTANAAQQVTDNFDGAEIDPRTWTLSDSGSHLRLTAAGLTVTGGTGKDGDTALQSANQIEIGGTLVLEVGDVQLGAGSDGVLCGIYTGSPTRASCLAGFDVRQSGGATVIRPLVDGVQVGTAAILQTGHRYTLRLRIHCKEVNRVRQIFYAMSAGTVQSFGGGIIDAGVNVVLELRDSGQSSNSPATVLYDGSLPSSPATCRVSPVNSLQLTGSIGYCRLTEGGSMWVTIAHADGSSSTRLTGTASEGADCTVSSSGAVTFTPGRVPVAGEFVKLSYRSRRRAIARVADPQSILGEQLSGISGTARWLGHVLSPPARSSADCESAARALLSVRTESNAVTSGRYDLVNGPDIWPGDVLSIRRGNQSTHSIVREVVLEDGMSVPESIGARLDLSDGSAAGLGMKVSDAIATDTMLPRSAEVAPSPVVDDVRNLAVLAVSGAAIQIDAGEDPPVGGGFEVRRRDEVFGIGDDQDLVLRSAVRGFFIPRTAQVEKYFIRMYDASTPRVYSRSTTAVYVDVAVG